MLLRFMLLFVVHVGAASAWALPRALIVSPEQLGILQTGGLADATTGLAVALNRAGVRTDVLMPYFKNTELAKTPVQTARKFSVTLDHRDGEAHKRSDFSLLKMARPMNPTLFLRHETVGGQLNYFDNKAERGYKNYGPENISGEAFGAYAAAAAQYILSENYDVVVLNDWTSGLIAVHLYEAALQQQKVPKVIFAIHNLAYQGNFPPSLHGFLGLDWRHYTPDGYEFYDQLSFMKAGMLFSDITYTVSKQYSKEISTPRFGASLDGVVRHLQNQNRMFGILNGITEQEWDPARPSEGLKYTFSSTDLSGKGLGKAELQAEFGLPVTAAKPVFILTSRLAEQKGYEYLPDAIAQMAAAGESQWIIIGDGDPRYVHSLRELEERFFDSVRYRPFNRQLEKKLMRYGDFGVNGAWFEPSGLNQFYAMKNGTIPIVSEVGGLVDSVKRDRTGLLFKIVPGDHGHSYDTHATAQSAAHEFRRAIALFRNSEKLDGMRRRGMEESHSWDSRVRRDFLPLFNDLIAGGMPVSSSSSLGCESELAP